jgi:chemotaxis response regulator CheB
MSNTNYVVIAIALFSSVTAPLILTLLTGRQRRAEKEQDYAREDAVAEQAAKAAKLLLDSQKETRLAAEKVARVAAEAATSTDMQLERIHKLVNSDMTSARTEQLKAEREKLVALKRIVALDKGAGRKPQAHDIVAIDSTTDGITALEALLGDRLHQQRAVEAEELASKGKD